MTRDERPGPADQGRPSAGRHRSGRAERDSNALSRMLEQTAERLHRLAGRAAREDASGNVGANL